MQHAVHNSICGASPRTAGTAAGTTAGLYTGEIGRSSSWQLGTSSCAAPAPTGSGALQAPLDSSSTCAHGGPTSSPPVVSAGLSAAGWNRTAVHTPNASLNADAASGRSVNPVRSNLNAAEPVHLASSDSTSDGAVFGRSYMCTLGMSAAARSSASSAASGSGAIGTFWTNTVPYERCPTGDSAVHTDATDLGTEACTYVGKELVASVFDDCSTGRSVSGFSELKSLL